VAYSDFVRQAKRNEVAKVVVDGAALTYTLRPSAEWVRSLPAEARERVTLTTVRPADLAAPYDALLANGVALSALDSRAPGGLFGRLLVSCWNRPVGAWCRDALAHKCVCVSRMRRSCTAPARRWWWRRSAASAGAAPRDSAAAPAAATPPRSRPRAR
jgi:hypothetical protein